jgi:hypothetical protein
MKEEEEEGTEEARGREGGGEQEKYEIPFLLIF